MDVEECGDGAVGGGGGGDGDALARQFCRLGVGERDELVGRMREALDHRICARLAEFYLDMSDWNLHAAIGFFLECFPDDGDEEGAAADMRLVEVTPAQMSCMPPNAFVAWTWTLANTGCAPWPRGCWLRRTDDAAKLAVQLQWTCDETALAPGDRQIVRAHVKAPDALGPHTASYRLCTPRGLPFGDELWISILVQPEADMRLVDVAPSHMITVPPNAFVPWTWTLANAGAAPWPPGCWLRRTDEPPALAVQLQWTCDEAALAPGDRKTVRADVTAPEHPGPHKATYRLCTPSGLPFGDELWISIVVQPDAVTEDRESSLGRLFVPVDDFWPKFTQFKQ